MSYYYSNETRDRFWEKVDIGPQSECWNWNAGKQSKGYGSFGIRKGKTALAHRVAYEMEKREIPEGLVIRHSCDNRLCCNPEHLTIGTIAENNRDASDRGRAAVGEKNGRAKLNEIQVTDIRKKGKTDKFTAKDLAREYRVHVNTIYRILREEYWILPLAD